MLLWLLYKQPMYFSILYEEETKQYMQRHQLKSNLGIPLHKDKANAANVLSYRAWVWEAKGGKQPFIPFSLQGVIPSQEIQEMCVWAAISPTCWREVQPVIHIFHLVSFVNGQICKTKRIAKVPISSRNPSWNNAWTFLNWKKRLNFWSCLSTIQSPVSNFYMFIFCIAIWDNSVDGILPGFFTVYFLYFSGNLCIINSAVWKMATVNAPRLLCGGCFTGRGKENLFFRMRECVYVIFYLRDCWTSKQTSQWRKNLWLFDSQ